MPAALARWERAHSEFVDKSGGHSIPENWKLMILLKMIPESEKERVQFHFKYAAATDKTYHAVSSFLLERAGQKAYDYNMAHPNKDDIMDCS